MEGKESVEPLRRRTGTARVAALPGIPADTRCLWGRRIISYSRFVALPWVTANSRGITSSIRCPVHPWILAIPGLAANPRSTASARCHRWFSTDSRLTAIPRLPAYPRISATTRCSNVSTILAWKSIVVFSTYPDSCFNDIVAIKSLPQLN